MKKIKLPVVFVSLAAAGFALRHLVYVVAVDEKNLIVTGHPAVISLWAVTAAALVLAAFAAWKNAGSPMSFAPFAPAFLSHGLLGAAVVMTVLLNPAPMPGLPAPLDRPITEEEYDSVLSWMFLNDLEGFTQEDSAADTAFIPDF